MKYRLTARETSNTTVWSNFTADNDDVAIQFAKSKLQEWESVHDHVFAHARLWKSLFGIPMVEVAYLDPSDWRDLDADSC